MSDEERRRWDERYASGEYRARPEPSPFLVERLAAITPGRALDVASGEGRHALHLAEHGWEVDAVDISEVALERCRQTARQRGLRVSAHALDLDDAPLPGAGYDLITVFRYRNPGLWPRLRRALAPTGWIVIEHHLRTHLDAGGPPSDEFRLEPGEPLRAFPDLRVVHYSESVEPADLGDGADTFVVARYAACAGDPGW